MTPLAKKKAKKTNELTSNRKTRHDYFIGDSPEAGLVLMGTEVESIRKGNVSLADVYAPTQEDEIYVENIHIALYEEGNRFNVDPLRKRKLLLHRKEVQKLKKNLDQEGKTLVPLKLHLVRGRIKMELGLVQGEKLYGKRQALREKKINRRLRDFTKC